MSGSAASIQWTPEQRLGIETIDRSVLLSAAAGSGKTAVLAARCAHLVCDAQPPCDVDQLLVVTFTKAAAAEMRQRIEGALRKRLGDSDDPRLTRQLALIDRAQISTIHSFCSSVLRQHFNVLGIDPNFRTLEEEEALLLRNDVARELFADRYESDTDGQFQRFIDGYGDGNDEPLLARVIRTYDTLCSLVDPQGWLNTARRRIVEAAEEPLRQSRLGQELIRLVGEQLETLRRQCIDAAEMIRRMGGLEAYLDHVGELLATIEMWQQAFGDGDFDALAPQLAQFSKPKAPIIRNAPDGKALAKEAIDAIKKEMDGGQLSQLARFSEAEWRSGMQQTLEPAQVFLDLVEEFGRRYRQAKGSSMDFADLERLALRVLRDESSTDLRPSAAARLYHQRFHHVLVDEYQDINETQDAILHLVSRECLVHHEEPGSAQGSSLRANLFCVGDVKQSIYRFRLAEPALFIQRDQRFRRAGAIGTVIDLQKNYRSRGPLLQVLNGLFERLMTRSAAEIDYDNTQALHPGKQYPSANGQPHFTGAPVELHLLPKEPAGDADASHEPSPEVEELDRNEREALLIAQRIRQMMGHDGSPRMHVLGRDERGEEVLRPIRYSDIVILLRSMRYKSGQYAELLRAGGVPVHSESGTGFFEAMEIRDMLALLGALDNQRQDIPLAAVLRSPLAALPCSDDCLARIRLAYPSRRDPVPFHLAAVRYARERDDELAAALRDFFEQLSTWRTMAHRRPLAELLWTIYTESGYLAFCAGLPDGEQRVANLISLHERARQFGTFQRQGLSRFMQFLRSLQEESDLGQSSIATEADDVVRIMSVHRSKGLEFPVVILPDLGRRHNLSDCAGSILVDRDGYLGLSVVDETRRIRYPSLASMLLKNRLRRKMLAEELRVLYVATTRAREHLILVGTCKEDAAESWRNRWGHHTQPLPADIVLGSGCMLDWIGPVAAAMQTAPHRIEITQHTSEQLNRWAEMIGQQHQPTAALAPLADLQPLDPPPPHDPAAQEITRRISQRYPRRAFTVIPAVQSVTGLTKQGSPVAAAVQARSPFALDRTLAKPRCVTEKKISAADIGLWTHVALQHLDFTRPCDPADIALQLTDLVRRRLMAADHAPAVDIDAITWFVHTPLGQLIREHAKSLRREMTVYVPAPPGAVDPSLTSNDPLDRIMIRGRIDLLIPTRDGLVLVDYKTDAITPDDLPQRIALYRPQVHLYRDAIAKITSDPVTASHLVFLTPKSIETL